MPDSQPTALDQWCELAHVVDRVVWFDGSTLQMGKKPRARAHLFAVVPVAEPRKEARP